MFDLRNLPASSWLFLGLLAPASLAQVQDSVSFPFVAEPVSMVAGTTDFRAVPGAFDQLLGKSELVMTQVPLPGVGGVDLDLQRIEYDFSSMGVQVNGQSVPNDPGNLTLWQGTVSGEPGSDVLIGFSSYGSYGWIQSQGEYFHMISYPGPGNVWAHANIRLVPDQVMSSLGAPAMPLCNADTSNGPAYGPALQDITDFANGSQSYALGVTLDCKIAMETDYEYYTNWNNLSACQNYTNLLLAAMSSRYQSQINVVLTYPYVGYYTSNNDPWTAHGSGIGAMLDQFRTTWTNAIPAGANIAHLLSGGIFQGGLAYLDVLCSQTYGFGVSTGVTGGTQFPVVQSSNTWDFVVAAHEIGHNFGTSHTHNYCPPIDQCASPSYWGACQTATVCISNGTIMSYCHTCSPGMPNITTYFHPQVVAVMRAGAVASCIGPYSNCVSDYLEPNDDCFIATAVSAGSYAGLNICDSLDDYYRVTVGPYQHLTWDLSFVHATGDIDCNLFDVTCSNQLDGSYSTTNAESVEWTNTSNVPVDVKLHVYLYCCAVNNAYDMNITLDSCAADDAYENNDDCSAAYPIGDGTIPGLLISAMDKDHYSTCVAAGATIDVSLLFTNANGDTDCFLWDAADGNCGTGYGTTALVYGYSATDNEFMSWTNNTGSEKDVVIEVNLYSGACNVYDLIVSGSGGCGVGTAFCAPMNPNSTGASTTLTGAFTAPSGSGLHLEITSGPASQFGSLLVGPAINDPGVPLSQGRFCIGGAFGRYNIIGGTMNSIGLFDSFGVFQNIVGTSSVGSGYDVPLTLPYGGSPLIQSGDTWNFQCWHRENGGVSNFSNGLSVTF